ncbi:hypothetical protein DTO169E5_1330 [Paecilomyces variotii]|nr:hypothetical protein DTO169E5_1330 [Paecilomyces variotii]
MRLILREKANSLGIITSRKTVSKKNIVVSRQDAKGRGTFSSNTVVFACKGFVVARFCKIKARVKDDFIIRAFQLIGECVQFPVSLMFFAQLKSFLRPLRPGKVFYFGPSPKVLKNERLRKAKTLSTLIHIVLCTSQSLHLRSVGQNKRLKHVHRDAVVIITK